MADNIDNLGLDASQYIQEVDKINRTLNEMGQRLNKVADSLGDVSNNMGRVTINITDLDEAGNHLRATLKSTDDGWKVLSSSIGINVNKQREAREVAQATAEALERQAEKTEKLRVFTERLQKSVNLSSEAIANFSQNQIANFQRLFDLIDATATRINILQSVSSDFLGKRGLLGAESASVIQQPAVRATDLSGQTLAQNQANLNAERATEITARQTTQLELLARATENIIIDNNREAAAIAATNAANSAQIQLWARLTEAKDRAGQAAIRERNASQFGQAIQANFGKANPEQAARSLQTITGLIEKGQIEASRALQIVDSVTKGTKEVFTGIEGRVASASRSLVASNTQSTESFKKVQDAGEKAARGINLSWQALIRIFLVQSIHTIIGRFIGELRQATKDAETFEIKISEIRTISQENQLSFAQWSSEVRRLSDEFGNPINEVAAGLYETISNQIAKGAESALFMSKALEFARTTVSTTDEAVNLLSSAINSYHLSVGDADRVSAILFKTIDLGRVRASELADTFGRVLSLAAPLGVSLEEVAASIATLTINGIKYNEAYTLVNRILFSLVNPTKQMKELLHSWGFESGQAAISAIGFEGVLKRLDETMGGNVAELAELLKNIRSTRGALGLTGSAFATFERDLAQIRNSSAQYQAATVIAAESAGRTFQIEVNRIKNIFISDFGEKFLNLIAGIGRETDEAGRRVHGFSDTFRDLIRVGETALEIFIAYKAIVFTVSTAERIATAISIARGLALSAEAAGAERLSVANLLLGKTFSGLTSAVGIATIVAAAAIYQYNLQKEALDQVARFAEEAAAKRAEIVDSETKQFNVNIDQQTQKYTDSLTERLRLTFQHLADLRKLDDQYLEYEKANLAEIEKATKNTFDLQIKSVEEGIRKLEQAATTATSNAQAAFDRIRDLQEGLRHTTFEREVGLLPGNEQVRAREDQIKKLNQIAADRLAKVSTTDAIAGKDALKQATQEQNEADRLSNDLLKQREEVSKKHIETEAKIKELEARGGAKTVSREDRENQEAIVRLEHIKRPLRNAELNELRQRKAALKDIKEAHGDAESDRRDKEQLEKLKTQEAMESKILAALGPSANLEKTIADETARRTKELAAYQKIQEDITKAAEDQKKKEQERLEILRDLVTELGKFKLPPDLADAAGKKKALGQFDIITGKIKAAGGSPELLLQLAKERTEFERQADLEIQQHQIDTYNETLQKNKEAAIKNQQDLANRIKDLNTEQANEAQKIRDLVEEQIKFAEAHVPQGSLDKDAVQTAREAAKAFDSSPSAKNALNLTKAVEEFNKIIGPALANIKEPDAYGKGGRSQVDLLNDLQKAINKLLTLPGLQGQAAAAQVVIDANAKVLGLKQPQAQIGNTTNDIDKFGQKFIQQIQAQAAAFNNLEASINAAAAKLNQLGGGIPHHALGGASLARGTDTIPAMLSPGEFIVNAAATRQYYNELKSMNSLSYLSDGGYVAPGMASLADINFNSGDNNSFQFNVTAERDSAGNIDIVAVGRQLERAIRAGTINLKERHR